MSNIDVHMRDASDAAPARSRSVHSDAPPESGAEGHPGHTGHTGRQFSHRRKGVFDAVGGRTRVREPRPPKWPGQPIKYRHARLAPEEALFRSAGAPPRYEETDTYFAHADLPAGALPPSELVKAVHNYASHFYEVRDVRAEGEKRVPEGRGQEKRAPEGRGQNEEQAPADEDMNRQTGATPDNRRLIDERSLDETALLAFGILLEEAGRAVLGRNGALVLTEAAADGEEDAEYEERDEVEEEVKKKKRKKSKKRNRSDADG